MPGDENFVSSLVALIQYGLTISEEWCPFFDDVQQDIGVQENAHSESLLNPVFFLIVGHSRIIP